MAYPPPSHRSSNRLVSPATPDTMVKPEAAEATTLVSEQDEPNRMRRPSGLGARTRGVNPRPRRLDQGQQRYRSSRLRTRSRSGGSGSSSTPADQATSPSASRRSAPTDVADGVRRPVLEAVARPGTTEPASAPQVRERRFDLAALGYTRHQLAEAAALGVVAVAVLVIVVLPLISVQLG